MKINLFPTVLAGLAAVGLANTTASADPFFTSFEDSQEQFDGLAGEVVTVVDGAATPHSGDAAYYLGDDDGDTGDNGEYLNFGFGGTAQRGSLSFWIYDPGNLPGAPDENGDVPNSYGPRWGLTPNGLATDSVLAIGITQRNFTNPYPGTDRYSLSTPTQAATNASWFSLVSVSPPRFIDQWSHWVFENITTADAGLFNITGASEDGTTTVTESDVPAPSNMINGGIGGFYLYGGGKSDPGSIGIYVDDITFTPLPEPASLTLLALSGLALTGRRRR